MTSVDRANLKERLQPALVQDFDGLWDAWVAESGSEDVGHFVSHLLEWKLIPSELGEGLLPNLDLEEDPTDLAPWSSEPSQDLSDDLAVVLEPDAADDDAVPMEPDTEIEPDPPGGRGEPYDEWETEDAAEILDPSAVAHLLDAAYDPSPTYEDEDDTATALMARPTPDSLATSAQPVPAKTQVSRDPALGRRVSVRTLGDTASADQRRRFAREAAVAAQLDHPGVPAVLELRPPETYVQRLIEGVPLRQILDEARAAVALGRAADRSTADLLDRFVQVCDTIAYSAARGLAHGNLHPDTILVGAHGATWVTDWGLAQVFSIDVPEPMDLPSRGDEAGADARSDVRALGRILYEILTLRTPPAGAPSDWTHRFGLPIDPALRDVAAAALDPRPTSAFADARALAEAVRRARGARSLAPAASLPEPIALYAAIGLGVGWLATLFVWMISASG